MTLKKKKKSVGKLIIPSDIKNLWQVDPTSEKDWVIKNY